MQYFRFLPDPAKLRKEARWSGVSSAPDIGERVQPAKWLLDKHGAAVKIRSSN
jgi:hypothetical protein